MSLWINSAKEDSLSVHILSMVGSYQLYGLQVPLLQSEHAWRQLESQTFSKHPLQNAKKGSHSQNRLYYSKIFIPQKPPYETLTLQWSLLGRKKNRFLKRIYLLTLLHFLSHILCTQFLGNICYTNHTEMKMLPVDYNSTEFRYNKQVNSFLS